MASVIPLKPRYYLWSRHDNWEINILELRAARYSRLVFLPELGSWTDMKASDIEFREDTFEMIFQSPTVMGILECQDMSEALRLSIIKWMI